jgi:hypothetical protein
MLLSLMGIVLLEPPRLAADLVAAFFAAAFLGAALVADDEPEDLDADFELLFEEELFGALFLLVVFAMINIFLVNVLLTSEKLMPVIQNQPDNNMKNIFHMYLYSESF